MRLRHLVLVIAAAVAFGGGVTGGDSVGALDIVDEAAAESAAHPATKVGSDGAAPREAAASGDRARVLDLPPRPADAPGGRSFIENMKDAGIDALEDAVVDQVLAGNVPEFLRTLVPVHLEGPDGGTARVHVTSDYLAIGDETDFVHVPLRAATAEELATKLGASLPTPDIVDAIVEQAEVRLPPRSVVTAPAVVWSTQSLMHDRSIDALDERFGGRLGALTVGHMKDVVLSPVLTFNPEKVAIYGLHDLERKPIQPLSVLHVAHYVDYSHGIRLVADRIEIDGEPSSLAKVLADEERSRLVSRAGSVRLPAYAGGGRGSPAGDAERRGATSR